MKLFQPVIWSKGTFLTPQHLQAQDRFIESQLHFQIDALNFRPWGFYRLTIDQAALAVGEFRLSAASGILPDGLPFDIPDSDPLPDAKPLVSYFEANDISRDVYLAIPQYVERGLNVAQPNHHASARFVADVAMHRDETNGIAERPVQVARKKFRVLVQGESREGSTSIRVARINRTAAGVFGLDTGFVPPMLNFHGSDFLVSVARRLLETLSAKSADLSGIRRQKNQSLADFTLQDTANFWLLYTINSHLLPLRHLFEARHAHPERLFALMLSLAGALTTFSSKIQLQDLPLYDHADLESCFGQLDKKTRLLLETVVPRNFASLNLKYVQPSIYAAAIDDDKYLAGAKLYLAISAQMGEVELINKAPQLLKMSSASHLEHLLRHALPGITLTHIATPPNPIPIKTNCHYFSLNQAGPAWDAMAKARNVAAYVPADFPKPQLELIVVLPTAD